MADDNGLTADTHHFYAMQTMSARLALLSVELTIATYCLVLEHTLLPAWMPVLTTFDQLSIVAAGVYIGAVVGALFFGWLGGKILRSYAHLLPKVFMFGGMLGTAVLPLATTTYQQIFVMRFITGIGVGGEIVLNLVVTTEASSPAERSHVHMGMTALFGLGALCVSLMNVIAPIITPTGISQSGYYATTIVPIPLFAILPVAHMIIDHSANHYDEPHLGDKLSNYTHSIVALAGMWFFVGIVGHGTATLMGSIFSINPDALAQNHHIIIGLLGVITPIIATQLRGEIAIYVARSWLVLTVTQLLLLYFVSGAATLHLGVLFVCYTLTTVPIIVLLCFCNALAPQLTEYRTCRALMVGLTVAAYFVGALVGMIAVTKLLLTDVTTTAGLVAALLVLWVSTGTALVISLHLPGQLKVAGT